ncbi:MAG: ATP-binding protein [Puia sp.]|nr:ATP-binding protein [Puia sp.]
MLENDVVFALFIVVVFYALVLFGFISLLVPHVNRVKYISFQAKLHEMQARYDRELLRSQLEIQEETLTILGRELHDNIGQKIYLSRLYLSSLDPQVRNNSEALKAIDSSLTEAAEDLHGLLRNFSMDLIKKGDLRKAIEGLVFQLRRVAIFKIVFLETGFYESLPEQKEIFVFRILQEAINNIIRHAAAKSIEIQLTCSAESVVLSIRDDGLGFDMASYPVAWRSVEGRNGIENMIERAKLIDAKLAIDSKPYQGTLVRIEVSTKNNQNEN